MGAIPAKCKSCGKEFLYFWSKEPREFCNDNCEISMLKAEVNQLRDRVQELEEENNELRREVEGSGDWDDNSYFQ